MRSGLEPRGRRRRTREFESPFSFYWCVLVALMIDPRYVSELCYIHTKCMIVDDKRVIVGCNLPSPKIHGSKRNTDGLGQSQRPQSEGT